MHSPPLDGAGVTELASAPCTTKHPQGAPAFWNAVEDRILAGNATLLRELRAAMRRRRRGLGGSGG